MGGGCDREVRPASALGPGTSCYPHLTPSSRFVGIETDTGSISSAACGVMLSSLLFLTHPPASSLSLSSPSLPLPSLFPLTPLWSERAPAATAAAEAERYNSRACTRKTWILVARGSLVNLVSTYVVKEVIERRERKDLNRIKSFANSPTSQGEDVEVILRQEFTCK